MAIYFFKHPLISNGIIPGRFGYDVAGRALVAQSEGFVLEQNFKGRIYGDAYGDNEPGPNVDPNVLSQVLPWFLSYCRICDRKSRNLVRSEMKLLSELVKRGDLIVFGGDKGPTELGKDVIFVDTVLCVNRTVTIPRQAGSPNALDVREYCLSYSAELDLPPWNAFKTTRDYLHNLKDAEKGGNHYRTDVGRDPPFPHLQIIGTRVPQGKGDNLRTVPKDELLQRFLDGRGFDACPILPPTTDYSGLTQSREIQERPGIFVAVVPTISNAITQRGEQGDEIKVTRLAPPLGESLLRSIVHKSDKLVLDPIVPTGLLDVSKSAARH